MPKPKIAREGRDAMLAKLIGGDSSEPVVDDEVDDSTEADVHAAAAEEVVDAADPTEPEPEESADEEGPTPQGDSSGVEVDVVSTQPQGQSVYVQNDDPRLRPAARFSDKKVVKVQLANRIPVELKDRLDRHCRRTGETINSVMERMLEFGLEIAEAEAGVDQDGNPLAP